jgi:hypothetical protein
MPMGDIQSLICYKDEENINERSDEISSDIVVVLHMTGDTWL